MVYLAWRMWYVFASGSGIRGWECVVTELGCTGIRCHLQLESGRGCAVGIESYSECARGCIETF